MGIELNSLGLKVTAADRYRNTDWEEQTCASVVLKRDIDRFVL